MAKVYVDFLGAIIGSVGKVSYYTRFSDNIARRKGAARKSSDSPAAVDQRKRFGMLVKLTTDMQAAVAIGFPRRKKGFSVGNAFHHLNKHVCTVEGDTVTVDYERLLCAYGPLLPPEVTVSYAEETRNFTFNQTVMEEEVNCNADDMVYAAMLESVLGFCRVIGLHQRDQGGSTSVDLPKRWSKENVIIYSFAVSADKQKASKSLYLLPEEGA